MIQYITHFTKHTDEAAAKAALPSYWSTTATGWDWNRSIVDGPVPIVKGTGTFTTDPMSGAQTEVMQPVAGYFLNIALPALDLSLPALTGAGHTDPITKAWVRDWGTNPITPQREFA